MDELTDPSSPRSSTTGGNREVIDESFRTTGAVVMGRRTFNIGAGHWGDDPPFRVPCFVLTHDDREKVTRGATTFTFVTDGIESALVRAMRAQVTRTSL